MIDIQPLQWDSDFFGIRVGRVDACSQEELTSLKSKSLELKEQFDLLYLFCPQNLNFEQNGAVLADEKTIYTKTVECKVSSPDVFVYQPKVPNEELYELALVSGQYSRFKLDENFPKGSFEKLYNRWIEQSVNGNIANVVFVHSTQNHINGMMTVKWDDNEAHIGLVAVNPNCQSQGIGSILMQSVESYLSKNANVTKFSVATQWANNKAKHWYEKNGFTIESVTKIYHWWM